MYTIEAKQYGAVDSEAALSIILKDVVAFEALCRHMLIKRVVDVSNVQLDQILPKASGASKVREILKATF